MGDAGTNGGRFVKGLDVGVTKGKPILEGSTKMQMYGSFEGFALQNVLFGSVKIILQSPCWTLGYLKKILRTRVNMRCQD